VTLPVIVALTVGAAAQTRLGEYLVVALALLLQLDLGLEDVDLACPVGRHAVGQLVSPRRGHSAIPSIVAAAARENGAPSRAALERSRGAYLLPSRADHTTQGGRMLELGDPWFLSRIG
jgi:hypothetical protein